MILVSAYYDIPNKLSYTLHEGRKEVTADESRSFYIKKMKYLFTHVNAPIIFFTSSSLIQELKPLAGTNVTFIMKEFEELGIFQTHPPGFWMNELSKDNKLYCHTWQIGALWANKIHFIKDASCIFPDEQWFMWIDAGCIRGDIWIPYLEDFCTRNYISLSHGVYMQYNMEYKDNGDLGETLATYATSCIAGGIFICENKYIQTYINHYLQILDEYEQTVIPCILDQLVMSTMARRYNDYIHLIKNKLNVPDVWFFFLGCI